MAEKYSLALTLKILLLDFIYYIVTFISDIIDSVIVIVFFNVNIHFFIIEFFYDDDSMTSETDV